MPRTFNYRDSLLFSQRRHEFDSDCCLNVLFDPQDWAKIPLGTITNLTV